MNIDSRMDKPKTFAEWVRLREAAQPQELSPDLQKAAQGVMDQMGTSLTPPDPKMPMADYLKRNPAIQHTFAKKLLTSPAARKAGAGQVNIDMANQLLLGKAGQPGTT